MVHPRRGAEVDQAAQSLRVPPRHRAVDTGQPLLPAAAGAAAGGETPAFAKRAGGEGEEEGRVGDEERRRRRRRGEGVGEVEELGRQG